MMKIASAMLHIRTPVAGKPDMLFLHRIHVVYPIQTKFDRHEWLAGSSAIGRFTFFGQVVTRNVQLFATFSATTMQMNEH
jgi:hypothetical protein